MFEMFRIWYDGIAFALSLVMSLHVYIYTSHYGLQYDYTFYSPYFHVSNSALFLYSGTPLIHRRSLEAFFANNIAQQVLHWWSGPLLSYVFKMTVDVQV